MTWLGEICKTYQDSVENVRENMNLRSNLLIFCQRGGGHILVKYSPVDEGVI